MIEELTKAIHELGFAVESLREAAQKVSGSNPDRENDLHACADLSEAFAVVLGRILAEVKQEAEQAGKEDSTFPDA